jgi:hypothetical protein
LRSTSKIPPEFVETAPEVGGVGLDQVDAFGFHGALFFCRRRGL